MRAVITLVVLVSAAMLVAREAQAQSVLPPEVCDFCVGLFQAFGCISKESPICQFVALKFKIRINGNKLCDRFFCGGGYGTPADSRTCKGQLQCLLTKRQENGICPTNQICCDP